MSVNRKVKLNKLVFYVSISALVLFGLAYSQGVVKAEVVYENITSDGGAFYIPEFNNNGVLICQTNYNVPNLDSGLSTENVPFQIAQYTDIRSYSDYRIIIYSDLLQDHYYTNALNSCVLVSNLVDVHYYSYENYGLFNDIIEGQSITPLNNVDITNDLLLLVGTGWNYDEHEISDFTFFARGSDIYLGKTYFYFPDAIVTKPIVFKNVTRSGQDMRIGGLRFVPVSGGGGGGNEVIFDGVIWVGVEEFPLIPDTQIVFDYYYNKNILVGEGDYITIETCENSWSGNCEPLLFDNGVTTSTTSPMIRGGTIPYGKSNFVLANPANEIGTTTKKEIFYRITPYYQCALGACAKGQWRMTKGTFTSVRDYYADAFNATTTPEALFELSSYDLACSAEEWAEADNDNFFNMMRLKCSGTKTLIDIVFKISDIAKSGAELFIRGIKTVFPFSLPVKIYESFTEAETTKLPDELNFLNISDEDGNVYIPISKELLGSDKDYQMLVWGTDVFKNETNETGGFFNMIKVFSKYIIWLSFFILIWKLGNEVYDELN